MSGTKGHLKRLRLANRQLLILDDKAQKDEEDDGLITVLVFILGETARAANFSLNGYERDTNPLLAKQDIVYFKETPTCDTADIQNCTTQEIVNTYDNTILYTDYVVSSAIDILKKFPHFEGGLIYVSDHGESLGENNIYLHGMPYTIAPKEQIEVPMVLFMNENMKRFDFVDYDCMKKVAQTTMHSHDNLFHSIFGLLEINTKEYDQNLDLFRACRTKKLRFEK